MSVGTEGAIFLWKTPEEVSGVPNETQEVREASQYKENSTKNSKKSRC